MKTAVQILFEEMNRIRLEDECENIGAIDFFKLQNEAFEKSKEIEKQQMFEYIKQLYVNGEHSLMFHQEEFEKYYKQKYEK